MTTLRLRQLQILHRHGDRTPLRNVFRRSATAAEELEEQRLWERQLPPSAQLAVLREKYAVRADEHPLAPGAAAASMSTAAAVTGATSHASYQQRPFGYLTSRGIDQMIQRGERVRRFCVSEDFAMDELQSADVQIFSNAYTRTQLSVQALLGGLFRDAPQVLPSVRVLPPETDMINTYAAFPEIARLKEELEQDDAAFAQHEDAMRRVKHELVRAIPMFASGAVPFTWMYAADYFMCRRAHGVSLVTGTEPHADATVGHLGFRFHQFYSHRRILQLVAGRLVHNVLREMKSAIAELADSKKLVIYSGHDVSILSVLHAVNASLIDEIAWWPEYSSALSLELLEDETGRWFVRLRLDGEVLPLKHSSSPVLAVDDFVALVSDRIGQTPP